MIFGGGKQLIKYIKLFPTEPHIQWLAAGLGAFVATWVVLNTQGVINKDATLYVRVASLFVAGEWKQGIELYNWPLYPLILAAGHYITGLHFQTVGHLFSITSFSLSSVALVLILREAGGNRNVMIAGLLVFGASPYLIGDVIPGIVREHGFWVFLLWGLWCLMHFYNTNRIIYALGWGFAALVAMLFRIEGFSFFLVLPIALFFQTQHSWQTRLGMFLKAHIVLVGSSIILLWVLLLNPSLRLDDLGRLHDPLRILVNVFHEVTQGLHAKAEIYGVQVLGKWLEEYALAGLLLTLGWALMVKIVGTAGLAQCCLFTVFFMKHQFLWGIKACPVLMFFSLIGLINSFFILLSSELLSQRMIAPLAFAIQLFAAFVLAGLYQGIRNPEKKTARVGFLIVSVLLAGQLIKTMWPPDRGSAYEISAVKWVEANKKSYERVYYDSERLRYYAGDYTDVKNRDWSVTKKLIQNHSVDNYDYLVVHGPQKSPDQEKYITEQLGKPIKVFDNERRNKVLVYRILRHPHHNQ